MIYFPVSEFGFCLGFQALIYDHSGKNLEIELFDEDTDKDDFLGWCDRADELTAKTHTHILTSADNLILLLCDVFQPDDRLDGGGEGAEGWRGKALLF